MQVPVELELTEELLVLELELATDELLVAELELATDELLVVELELAIEELLTTELELTTEELETAEELEGHAANEASIVTFVVGIVKEVVDEAVLLRYTAPAPIHP